MEVLYGKNAINQLLVIGLGRIGLPQSLILASKNILVYGYDINSDIISHLKQHQTPFYEPTMQEYLDQYLHKSFYPYEDWHAISQHMHNIDAIIFTVGTHAPTDEELSGDTPFDLKNYFDMFEKIFSNDHSLKKNIHIIIRTTLPLGSTDRLKNHIEKQYSLKEGEDFFLTFVPERISEGCAMHELQNIPVIIGAYSNEAFNAIRELFEKTACKVIRVRNPITAEFCKLTDNSFRSTVFSFSNDIAMFANSLDINVEEVIHVINDHYERNHIPQPGFVSGYCLTKDPYIFEINYLERMKPKTFHSVWYHGRKTNDYLVDFVAGNLLKQIKSIENGCVAILGLSFKENIDDFRMSHAFQLIKKLISNGIKKLNIYDPYINNNSYTHIPKEFSSFIQLESKKLDETIFQDVDAIVLCTCHQVLMNVNKLELLSALLKNTKNPCYVFDGWDCWEEASQIEHIRYHGIGFKKRE